MTIRSLVYAFAAAAILAGCGVPADNPAAAAPATPAAEASKSAAQQAAQAAKPAEAAKPAPPAKPAEAPKPAQPAKPPAKLEFGPNFAGNPAMGDWADGKPVLWSTAQGAHQTWSEAAVKQADGHRPESKAIELPEASAGHYVVAGQDLKPEYIVPGKTLYLATTAIADRRNGAQLVLTYREDGIAKSTSAGHPGTGSWQPLRLQLKVPAKAEPASFRIELVRAPGAMGRVVFSQTGAAYTKVEWAEVEAAAKAAAEAKPAEAKPVALAPATPGDEPAEAPAKKEEPAKPAAKKEADKPAAKAEKAPAKKSDKQ